MDHGSLTAKGRCTLHEMRQGEPRTCCGQWGQRPPAALTRVESLAGGERHLRVSASAHDIEATVEGERGRQVPTRHAHRRQRPPDALTRVESLAACKHNDAILAAADDVQRTVLPDASAAAGARLRHGRQQTLWAHTTHVERLYCALVTSPAGVTADQE